jgi:hypothetical protein
MFTVLESKLVESRLSIIGCEYASDADPSFKDMRAIEDHK